MNRLILPLALLLCTASAPVLAGGHEQHGDMCPMHDAMMSDAERAEAMDKMFAKLDANKDGSISRAEFDEHNAAMRKKHEEKRAEKRAEEHAEEQGDKHEH